MAEPETCPRCGTFAVLESNGFRRVCGPCLPLVRHPAELANGDPVKLLAALWQVLRELGPFTLGLSVLLTLPLMALQAFEVGPPWLPPVLQIAAMTVVESVSAFVFRDRVLAAAPRAPIPWQPALVRAGGVFGVNIVGSIGLSCCSPMVLAYGPFMAAVGLAALEGTGPIDSFVVAWKRSEGQRIALSVAALAPMVPAFVLYLIPAVVGGIAAGSMGLQVSFTAISTVMLLLFAVLFVPANLFQLVAWLATRPQPQRVDAASS